MPDHHIAIWLDQTKDRDGSRAAYLQLCKSAPYLHSFRDSDKCIDYITNLQSEKTKIAMIISSDSVEYLDTLMEVCEALSSINSIYLLCPAVTNAGQRFNSVTKMFQLYCSLQSLCDEMQKLPTLQRQRIPGPEDVRDDDLTFSKTSPSHVIIRDSSVAEVPTFPQRQESQFMYAYLLRKVLGELKSTEKEMIDFCREKYADDETQLNYIKEFEDSYEACNAVFWYTRDIFLYRILNKALREQDIRTLYSMRYFIKDLHIQLTELHSSQKALVSHSSTETVFRGQLMDNEEFDKKLRDNIEGFFSVCSFLSTTHNRELACLYAGDGSHTTRSQSVLFQIDIDKNINRFAYANIAEYSVFREEEAEILFTMGAVFRIESIRGDGPRSWTVKLKLTEEEDKELATLTERILREINVSDPLGSFVELMVYMADYELAEQCCLQMLQGDAARDNAMTRATLHNNLGFIYKHRNQERMAVENYQKSINLKLESVPDTDPRLAATYANLGRIYYDKEDLETASDYFSKAISIKLREPVPDVDALAIYASDTAAVYMKQKRYQEALHIYEKCLESELKSLPTNHPKIATTYHNISQVHVHQGDHSKAEFYQKKSLQIKLQSLPPDHPSTADTYDGLSKSLYEQGKLQEAVEHMRHAYKIRRKVLACGHPDLVLACENLQRLEAKFSFEQKDYARAAEWFSKILQNKLTYLSPDDPDLAATHSYLAKALENQGKLKEALEHVRIAFRNKERALPIDTHEVAFLLMWLSKLEPEVSFQEGNNETAEMQWKRRLHTLSPLLDEASLSATHRDLSRTLHKQGKLQEAVEHMRHAYAISSTQSPSDQSEIVQLRGWLAQMEAELERSQKADSCTVS